MSRQGAIAVTPHRAVYRRYWQTALVDVSGVQREVSMECVVDEGRPLAACVGQWVLVHVGFAMSLINEEEEEATLKILGELGEVQAELTAIRESGVGQT